LERMHLLRREAARDGEADRQRADAPVRNRDHVLLDGAGHVAERDVRALGGDRHRGNRAGEQRGREQIGRRERFAAPVVVEGRVGLERRVGWAVASRAAKRTVVAGGDGDHGRHLTARVSVCVGGRGEMRSSWWSWCLRFGLWLVYAWSAAVETRGRGASRRSE